MHRRKGISLVFALLPFPRPSFFHLFSLSLPPHRLLPPNFTRTPLDFRSICRYTRPLFPLHPPLSPFIVGPRLPTWLRQFNNSQPAATPHLLICSEFLTASPLETVAKKLPRISSPPQRSPLFSFLPLSRGQLRPSSSSSLFHLPSTCNLVGTHVTMVVENSKDRPLLGSMLASNLHVLSPRYRVWLTKREQKEMCTGWISAKTGLQSHGFSIREGEGVDFVDPRNKWSNFWDE